MLTKFNLFKIKLKNELVERLDEKIHPEKLKRYVNKSNNIVKMLEALHRDQNKNRFKSEFIEKMQSSTVNFIILLK